MGLVEVEKLGKRYDLNVRFAPFLLDPTTPPEGKPRRQMTQPGDPPTAMEARAQSLGITFSRGRTITSNSHLSLEVAEFATEEYPDIDIHRALFKAYFTDLEDIGNVDTLIRIGIDAGLPEMPLREVLETRRYRAQVDEGIAWSQAVGVTAVPTFVVDERYGIVGAQEQEAFEQLFKRLGRSPRA